MALVVSPLSDTHVPSSDYPREPLSLLFEDNHEESPRSCPAEGDFRGIYAFISAFVIAQLRSLGDEAKNVSQGPLRRGAQQAAPLR